MLTPRPVDQAMAAERRDKEVMRLFWLEQTALFHERYPDEEEPLYVTLCGAEARDIRLLIERNIVELTEVGSIAAKYQRRIVAVERSSTAVLALQRQFPGLKIVERDFPDLISGNSLIRFPTGKEEERLCRARIINLDLNSPLQVKEEEGSFLFPVFAWIKKLCHLHAKVPHRDWCLCLTLNATIEWPPDVSRGMQNFLRENFRRSERFRAECKRMFGPETYLQVDNDTTFDFNVVDFHVRQRLLMTFVPKKIAQLVHNDGWRIDTSRNVCYGGNEAAAPMVSWVFQFVWDPRAATTPEQVYLESLASIFSSVTHIKPDGTLQELLTT